MSSHFKEDYKSHIRKTIFSKFPKAEVTAVSDKFMITENGKNIIDDTYGEDVRTSDSIEQAWIRAYTTNFVWDRNLNRRVKGVSKPSEFDNQQF